MKSFRQIVLTFILIAGVFGAATYTACNKDACSGLSCSNAGMCVSGTCMCDSGYESTSCAIISRVKFIKVWNASEISSGPGGSQNLVYPVTISANTSSADVTQVSITGIAAGTPRFNNFVQATVLANIITVPTQDPDNNGHVINGSGTYINGIITWTYTITHLDSVTSISGTWQ